MKKVCNLNDNDRKILRELRNNSEGLRVQTIMKLTGLKQRVVYKRLGLLRDMELIENVLPIWKIFNGQVEKCAKLLNDTNIFELHNISYVVKLLKNLEVRNNDFNRLNDALANQIKKEKGKFLVEIDKRRKVWVDMSEPFGKEANYPEGQEKLEKITKDYLTKEVMLPSEIQQLVGENAMQINHFGKHLGSHVEAIQTLSSTVKDLQKEIKRLNKIKR